MNIKKILSEKKVVVAKGNMILMMVCTTENITNKMKMMYITNCSMKMLVIQPTIQVRMMKVIVIRGPRREMLILRSSYIRNNQTKTSIKVTNLRSHIIMLWRKRKKKAKAIIGVIQMLHCNRGR